MNELWQHELLLCVIHDLISIQWRSYDSIQIIIILFISSIQILGGNILWSAISLRTLFAVFVWEESRNFKIKTVGCIKWEVEQTHLFKAWRHATKLLVVVVVDRVSNMIFGSIRKRNALNGFQCYTEGNRKQFSSWFSSIRNWDSVIPTVRRGLDWWINRELTKWNYLIGIMRNESSCLVSWPNWNIWCCNLGDEYANWSWEDDHVDSDG